MDRYMDACELCIDYFDENGISFDKEDVQKCIFASKADNAIVTNVEMGLSDIEFIFSIVNDCAVIEGLKKELNKMSAPNVLLLSPSMAIIKKLEALTKKYRNKGNITIQLFRENNNRDYTIGIDSRVKSISKDIEAYKGNNNILEKVQGNIYSATLYDIIDIYNSVGDELFKKNVRFGIKADTIGVGNEIKETLNNHPEQFWFFNNGITIVADEEIDKSKKDSIKLIVNEQKRFSIVNGAQTVSAAHDFFFGDKYNKENVEKAKKEAKVLLRVVSVVREKEEQDAYTDGMSELISKSLNRQKPIVAEDLAYYTQFVKQVNQIYSSKTDEENGEDDRLFAIVRRGEKDNDTAYEHSLPLVARAIRASGYKDGEEWKYEPWKAINTYNSSILKTTEANDLADQKLFSSRDVKSEKLFIARYQYVNLAIYLYNSYQRLKNQVYTEPQKAKSKIDVLKSNGSWYFVTFFFKYILKHVDEYELISDCIRNASENISDNDIKSWMYMFFEGMDSDDDRQYKVSDLRSEEFYIKMDKIYNQDELKYESKKVCNKLLKKTESQ